MKRLLIIPALALASLATFGIASLAQAATQSITVTWTAPTQNVDNSAITGTLTYNILWGPSGEPYVQVDSAVAASGVHETVDFTKGSCVVVVAVEGTIASPYSTPFCFPSQPNAPTAVKATTP